MRHNRRSGASLAVKTHVSFSRAIYGNVLATSLVVAFSEDDDYSTAEIAVSVLVTGLVFWLAHVYASLIGTRYAVRRRLTRAEVGAEFYAEWPVVQAFFPPTAVLLLGTVGLLSEGTAVSLAIAGGVAAMVLWSLAIGRQERMTLPALIVMTLLNAAFGAAVVLLKVIVHRLPRSRRAIEDQSGHDRSGLRRRLVVIGVGAIQEVHAVHERGGSATIEVDRLLGPARDQQPRELRELEAAVDPGAASVAADRQELRLAETQRAARVATDRYVGVELGRTRGETLPILAVHQGAPAGHEQRPRLNQVAGGVVGHLLARRDADLTVDDDAPALRPPRRAGGLVRHDLPAYAHFAKRAVGVAQEKARDDGLRMALRGAPLIQPAGLREMDDAQRGRRQRVTHEIDRGLHPVPQPDSRQLVADAVIHGASVRRFERGHGPETMRSTFCRI